MSYKKSTALLDEAAAAIKDRDTQYGSPNSHYELQAALANLILKDKIKAEFPLSAADMVLLHALAVKGARLIKDPAHEDSQIDLAGYAALLKEVA